MTDVDTGFAAPARGRAGPTLASALPDRPTGSSPSRPTGSGPPTHPTRGPRRNPGPCALPAPSGCGRRCPVTWRSASSRGSTRWPAPSCRRSSGQCPSTASRSKAPSGTSSRRVSGRRSSSASTASALPAPCRSRRGRPCSAPSARSSSPKAAASTACRPPTGSVGGSRGGTSPSCRPRPRGGHAVHQRRGHLRLRRRDLRALDRGYTAADTRAAGHPRPPPETAARPAARRPAVGPADHQRAGRDRAVGAPGGGHGRRPRTPRRPAQPRRAGPALRRPRGPRRRRAVPGHRRRGEAPEEPHRAVAGLARGDRPDRAAHRPRRGRCCGRAGR